MVEGGGTWKLSPVIREKVLGRTRPSDEEWVRLKEVSSSLLKEIEKAISTLGLNDVSPMMAGSIAKGTVAGEPDLDVFILFPPDTSGEILKDKGIKIGEMVLGSPEKKYTQHPYITGDFMGYPSDIVPCRKIERGQPVSTAVDRTPHHTEYIVSRMRRDQKDDTILLKSFLKGIGSYGAEDTVNGFSGYLCELMILLHDSFRKVMEWFAGMPVMDPPPISADRISNERFMGSNVGPYLFTRSDLICERPEDIDHYNSTFAGQPIVIIDPVDPKRNVAAPVSDQVLAHTSLMARRLMKAPDEELFSPFNDRPFKHDPGKVPSGQVEGCSFSIPLPPDNPDMVITQARSFINRSIKNMTRQGDWKVWVDLILLFPPDSFVDTSYRKSRYVHFLEGSKEPLLVFTLFSDPENLPSEKVHWGPPETHRRARDFRDKWGKDTKVDHGTGKLFVIVHRDLVGKAPIFMRTWSDLKIGPSFKGTVPEPVENQLIHEVIWESSEH